MRNVLLDRVLPVVSLCAAGAGVALVAQPPRLVAAQAAAPLPARYQVVSVGRTDAFTQWLILDTHEGTMEHWREENGRYIVRRTRVGATGSVQEARLPVRQTP